MLSDWVFILLFIALLLALSLWFLLPLGRPLFQTLLDLMVASARSGDGMNPGRHRRSAPEREIWEMETRNRSA
ncbi:hypothetical protein EDB83DRAFT_629385 [Lactarius deliciosus]|nr:hypothetical protein EDB83DRAFT_629385 [Lactarius deliciosus]